MTTGPVAAEAAAAAVAAAAVAAAQVEPQVESQVEARVEPPVEVESAEGVVTALALAPEVTSAAAQGVALLVETVPPAAVEEPSVAV